MIVALAIATQTAPSQWRDEDDATIVTALDILRKQHEDMEKEMRKARGK